MFVHMLELNTDPILSAPVPAASIMLLRDAKGGGVEVLMLKRSQKSAVLGGVYVFPGGKLDAADRSPDRQASLGETPEQLRERIGDNPVSAVEAAAFFVAGCRETFEECGVRLKVSELVAWSRWTTPVMASFMKRRFDTQFFAAAMPSDQLAVHDDHEAVASAWFEPRDALQRYWAGAIELAPVQVMSLLDLSRFTDTEMALVQARRRRAPHILPEPFQQGEIRVVTYPGDARHSVPTRALPGPTRLCSAPSRFEPESGRFEDFFVNLEDGV
jgi:8-oxo-dGTP pyrophosphatase MutT (NUDIX family)